MRNKTQSHEESAIRTVNSLYMWLVNYLKVEKQKNGTKPPMFSSLCLCLGNIIALSYTSAQLMTMKTPLEREKLWVPKNKRNLGHTWSLSREQKLRLKLVQRLFVVAVFLQVFVQAWVLSRSPKLFNWKAVWKPNLKRVEFLKTRILNDIAKHNFYFLHWPSSIEIYRCGIWVSHETVNPLPCLRH